MQLSLPVYYIICMLKYFSLIFLSPSFFIFFIYVSIHSSIYLFARSTGRAKIWVCNKCVCSVIWLATILDAALFCQMYESVVIAELTGRATCLPDPNCYTFLESWGLVGHVVSILSINFLLLIL